MNPAIGSWTISSQIYLVYNLPIGNFPAILQSNSWKGWPFNLVLNLNGNYSFTYPKSFIFNSLSNATTTNTGAYSIVNDSMIVLTSHSSIFLNFLYSWNAQPSAIFYPLGDTVYFKNISQDSLLLYVNFLSDYAYGVDSTFLSRIQ
jgi:hypothetical protein